ncbi:hypothetical protein NUW58_g5647 [Xylaria curta]|uniref:Uncharacterized protein n=1 Tax=Xylaria curta TaxID=42375 RepID=A0ACC1P1E4_9PEZI|nr:hypothetical protein NUW58_g5647 [Xylaria curta]
MPRPSSSKVYNIVYPADFTHNTAAGARDINKITTAPRSSPDECLILQGYMQGAAAAVDALSGLTSASPYDHACNIDNNGGTTSNNASGLPAAFDKGVSDNWVIFLHYNTSSLPEPPDGFESNAFPELILGDFGHAAEEGDVEHYVMPGAWNTPRVISEWHDVYSIFHTAKQLFSK